MHTLKEFPIYVGPFDRQAEERKQELIEDSAENIVFTFFFKKAYIHRQNILQMIVWLP